MRILCITDQFEGSEHSSIEGVFGSHLLGMCEVRIVYFSREGAARRDANKLTLPYTFKRGNICAEIARFFPLDEFDVVVVRNFFPVLRDVLAARERYGFRVGFWNSFPHTYRRLFQAQNERHSLVRKSLEYRVRSFFETRLVQRCDFLVAMSQEFKDSFFANVQIPFFPLPMGVDFKGLPAAAPGQAGPLKMIYTGTVDALRRTSEVATAIAGVAGDFVLDIFTASDNEVTRRIAQLGDRRITIKPSLPRQELFQRMTGYDLGIGLIPENRLYNVSSPTKTLEYYGIGMPAMVNYLPEYTNLFDQDTAFFCEFTEEAIARTIGEVLQVGREKLRRMGALGRERIVAQRDYRVLAQQLHGFMETAVSIGAKGA